MRTVLAAAAAGALILGSAGGVVADPGKAQGPKKSTSASEPAMTKLQTVRIKGHKKIDLADENALQTQLKLRAKVRYSKKVSGTDALQSFEIKLGVFDKKVNGEFLKGSDSGLPEQATVELKAKSKERKNQFYAGSAVIADVWTPEQINALAAAVEANGKAYICTYSVPETFDKYSKQTRKRLGVNASGEGISRKTVRDCVKVVNSGTDSTSEAQPTS